MKILITGGAGFIGSHLTEALIKDDHEVTIVDSMSGCYPDNLDSVRHSAMVNIRHQDCAADDWRVDGDFDEIYHLAGVVATRDFMAHPVSALMTSLAPMRRILDYQLSREGMVRVLFASSSEVYGAAQVHPQPEDYRGHVSVTGPRSGYDEGKRATEALIAGYAREHVGRSHAAIVRLFNTYGPRMTANGRLVPTMVVDALRTGRITVNDPGSQTRTLLYISDCVSALRIAMSRQWPQPINIGGVDTLSMNQIADLIAAAVSGANGQTVKVVRGPPVPDEVQQRRPVLDRARTILGWEPSVALSAGLEHVIQYWKQRI